MLQYAEHSKDYEKFSDRLIFHEDAAKVAEYLPSEEFARGKALCEKAEDEGRKSLGLFILSLVFLFFLDCFMAAILEDSGISHKVPPHVFSHAAVLPSIL